jgi:hypothetical protein
VGHFVRYHPVNVSSNLLIIHYVLERLLLESNETDIEYVIFYMCSLLTKRNGIKAIYLYGQTVCCVPSGLPYGWKPEEYLLKNHFC